MFGADSPSCLLVKSSEVLTVFCNVCLLNQSSTFGSPARWEWLHALWGELASVSSSVPEEDRLVAVTLGLARTSRNAVAGNENAQEGMRSVTHSSAASGQTCQLELTFRSSVARSTAGTLPQ